VHATWFRTNIWFKSGLLGSVTGLQVSPDEEMVPASTTGMPVVRVPHAAQAAGVGQITSVSEATFAGIVSGVTVPGVVVLSARTTPCGADPVSP
jgi:hypothetical protein